MLNSAIIMGRLTADPELRTTASGLSVTSFSVAEMCIETAPMRMQRCKYFLFAINFCEYDNNVITLCL